MKKGSVDYLVALAGLAFLGVGLFLALSSAEPRAVITALPYVLVGIGCGAFGHGLGNIISRRAAKNCPEAQKQMRIDQNDERNVAIANRAKAKAYDATTYILGALLLCFALMGVDLMATLLLVCVYLAIHGYAIYFRVKYEKEM